MRMVGIKLRQVAILRDNGLPFSKRAGHVYMPMPEAFRWYISWRIDHRPGRPPSPSSMDEAKKRLESAKAELAELELAERRRDLIRVEDHKALLADAFARVASKLRNMPHRVATQVTGKTVSDRKQEATRIVDDIYQELHGADDIPEAPQ